MGSRSVVVARFAFVMLYSVLISALFGPRPVRAQADSETPARLRADLAALRTSRPEQVPPGSLTGIEYLLDVADRIERGFAPQAASWRAKAARYIEAVRAGRDPYPEQRGLIANRGYASRISQVIQGYTVYVPPDYDPSRRYPLLIMMHGGSSNGNLFLGVVLGNNMDWQTYSQHLWDDYTPRWSPDWIVVAPDGFGQVLWRWMGEQDVLDVLDDVQRHYSVDPDRIVLGGLSNGGLGAYAIGMRHAWRFSMVLAIAGAPSWVQYAGGSPASEELRLLHQVSAMHLIENSVNTDFRFFHGTRDPGPMRPRYVEELEEHMRGRGLTPQVRWYDHGHDLLYLVHRHGRAYPDWASIRRNPRPADVRVVTSDYRANRQHWVTVTRIDDYPRTARVDAHAEEGRISVRTDHALELALDLRDAPIGEAAELRILVDDQSVYAGPRAPLAHVVHISREGGSIEGPWRLGFLPQDDERLEKRPGISGPLTDPYRDGMVHVYGTQDPAQAAALRATAERGARGWPLWLWQHRQRVIADSEVTPEILRSSHLVLYGTPGSNSILERVATRLPIRIGADAIHVGSRTFRGTGVGTRFVYPNPEAPDRYLIVQAAPTLEGVQNGHNLPDFLPDWVVYEGRTTRTRQRLISGRNGQPAMGFFDDHWQLRGDVRSRDVPDRGAELGGDEGPLEDDGAGSLPHRPAHESALSEAERLERNRRIGAPADFVIPEAVLAQTPAPQLEAASAPPWTARGVFGAPRRDPAGIVARRLRSLIATFFNYRAIIPGGEWRVDRRARWQIRGEESCRVALTQMGVPTRPAALSEPLMPTPVEISGPVGGVMFRMIRPEDEPLTIACEMAARLPSIAAIARRHGIRAVDVLSAHRSHPRQSFHRAGLGLDVYAFETDRGERLSVYDDFIETPAHRTCDAPAPASRAARTLLEIACELADSWQFSSVLTPNYNDGHRNHFHIDSRPDDPRVFIR